MKVYIKNWIRIGRYIYIYIHEPARAREKKKRGLSNVRCIKSRIIKFSLARTIKERWKNNFHKLYTETQLRKGGLGDTSLPRDVLYYRRIKEPHVKSIGLDDIPIKI